MSGLILEDCPFCGNHKAVCKESSVFSWVACLICSAQGPACLTRPEARRAWNVASIKNRELLKEIARLRESESEWRHYSPPLPACGECGAEIAGTLYCLDCSNVCECETCGDREGGCPYCEPSAGWAK